MIPTSKTSAHGSGHILVFSLRMRDIDPRYLRGRGRRTYNLRPAWEKLVILYLKNKIQNKGARGIAYIVECFPIICKAPGSIPRVAK
jgi:hypothetical protein